MARLTRRSVVAGAAISTAAIGAAKAARNLPGAAPRNTLVVISDVHIGDNSPTVWYQQKYHEPYLKALFDHVIANADSIQELVILGDFVDFWTYPPDRRPPSFADIVAANPNVFGRDGMLNAALVALQGRVSYVPGNHDMSITQADLDSIAATRRYRISLQTDGAYFPAGTDRKILCGHGHHWTMFNAPDMTTRLAPLPIGHFATRAFCYQLAQILKPGQTVADLRGQGIPTGLDLGGLLKSINGSMIDTVVNYASAQTGLPMTQPIVLPSGDTTTLSEVSEIYRPLWSNWKALGANDDEGKLIAFKAALADIRNGTYLPWFAQREALATPAELVVYGHTHVPVRGLKDGFVDYVNTGFDCASMPDMASRHFTFVEVDLPTLQPRIMQVTDDAVSGFAVSQYTGAKRDEVVPSPAVDFSTYVTIDNRGGASDLTLTAAQAKDGFFVVAPPASVPRGETARFWIQDDPGGEGTKGTATYQGANGPVTLAFGCPTGVSSNIASGADFRAGTAKDDAGALNHMPHTGHPLFVQFLT
jgi:UDP-2,3-diacylglucosamine pyrophosphatase LpxH